MGEKTPKTVQEMKRILFIKMLRWKKKRRKGKIWG